MEDVNTPVSLVDGKSRQKISKDIIDIINTINILGPNLHNRTLYPTMKGFTLFSSAYEALTKTDHMINLRKVNTFQRMKNNPQYFLFPEWK